MVVGFIFGFDCLLIFYCIWVLQGLGDYLLISHHSSAFKESYLIFREAGTGPQEESRAGNGRKAVNVLGGAVGESWVNAPSSMRIQRKLLRAQPGDTHKKPGTL